MSDTLTIDSLSTRFADAAADIASYVVERLTCAAYELAEAESSLTVEKAIGFLADEGEIEAVAEAFPATVSAHLARTDPEILREALRDEDELQTFDPNEASRELQYIASEIERLVNDLRSTLDL